MKVEPNEIMKKKKISKKTELEFMQELARVQREKQRKKKPTIICPKCGYEVR